MPSPCLERPPAKQEAVNPVHQTRGRGRRRCLVLAVTGSLVLPGLFARLLVHTPPVWINLSASAPRGVYRRISPRLLSRGGYIVFPVPQGVGDLVASWGWPEGGLLLKQVGAVPGDLVCMVGGAVFVNTERVAVQLRHDRAGRALPRVRGCFRVRQDELLPLSTHHPRSFDGRYFGAIPRDSLTAVVTPLWIFDPGEELDHDPG